MICKFLDGFDGRSGGHLFWRKRARGGGRGRGKGREGRPSQPEQQPQQQQQHEQQQQHSSPAAVLLFLFDLLWNFFFFFFFIFISFSLTPHSPQIHRFRVSVRFAYSHRGFGGLEIRFSWNQRHQLILIAHQVHPGHPGGLQVLTH